MTLRAPAISTPLCAILSDWHIVLGLGYPGYAVLAATGRLGPFAARPAARGWLYGAE